MQEIPQTVNQISENSDSSVTIELGKSGTIEIRVKAGKDGSIEKLNELRLNALATFKELYNDDVIKKHVKEPKP